MTKHRDHEFEGAVATPVQHWNFGYSKYGLYDANDQKIKHWPILTSADNRFPFMPKSPSEPEEVLSGNWLYAGFFDIRFGHFITETIPNLLAVKRDLEKRPNTRILMHCWPDAYQDSLGFQEGVWPEIDYFMHRIGLPRDIFKFVDKPVRLETLFIGDAPFEGKFTYADSLEPLISDNFGNPDASRSNLYLSRTQWPHKPRVSNEAEIESVFAEKGFEIIHLQNHSLGEQIDIVTRANSFVGPQGTALHWSLFAPNSRFVLSLGGKSKLQAGISAFKNQSYREVLGHRVKWNYDRFRRVPLPKCQNALVDLI